MTESEERPRQGASAGSSVGHRVRPAAPSSVTVPAREFLDVASSFDEPEAPPLDDVDGWLARIEVQDARVRAYYESLIPPGDALRREEITIEGRTCFVLRPAGLDASTEATLFLEIHAGGLLLGGGEMAWMAAVPFAIGRAGETWCPDYRMPPRHPYPAALDDCVAAYQHALEARPASQIVVSGASAGGNLAAALLLRARDEGLPMPAGLVLLTPELDLTESGDTFQTNDGIDLLPSLMPNNLLYAAGADLSHPYLSPLFGDVTGLPPTFLQSGTRDLYLSNTVRMHRKLLAAGVPAELHVFEAMPHGGFGGSTPEDDEARTEARRFEVDCLARGGGTQSPIAWPKTGTQ